MLIIAFSVGSCVGCGQNQTESVSETNTAMVQDDIVILYTSDVHCGIDENIGYAGLVSYKEWVEEKTPYVTLVDCGDAVQGEVIGTVSNGEYLIDIMNEVGYELAVLGNHEFDYGMEQTGDLIEQANAQYLGCNISYTGEGDNELADVKPYEIIDYGDTSIAFIGVSTPYSVTSSTPTYFMDENGEYIYEFAAGEGGSVLFECIQKNVDECREAGADYVVLLTHLGDADEFSPYSSIDVIGATTGVDVVLDGHAHSEISCRVEKNKDGDEVLLSAVGTKLTNIGQLVITADGHITTGLVDFYTEKDDAITEVIEDIKASYEAEMGKVVAHSDIALSCSDSEGIRRVRNRETTIGNMCADAYRAMAGTDIAFVNGGGIRDDLPEGDITYADIIAVHPFGNTLCAIEVTGQEIMDFLEHVNQFVQTEASADGLAVGEDGSFQQVSGLKFTVDTSIPSSVVLDENGMFVSIEGDRRVKDIMIMNDSGEYEPIVADKTYTMASHNYLIKESGSGTDMFTDNVLLIDEGMIDYEILINYITENLNGEMSALYSETEGRIVIH